MNRRTPPIPVRRVPVEIEPVRIPGDFVWRPWLCIVHYPGKRPEPTGRRFTEDGARRAAYRLVRQLAAGRPFTVEIQ